MTPLEAGVERAHQLYLLLGQQLADVSNRIGTWLVVGHAGALALAFNAVLTGSTCDQALVAASIWRFALGLSLAFAATMIGQAMLTVGFNRVTKQVKILNDVVFREHAIEVLEAANVEVPDDSPLHGNPEENAQMAKLSETSGIALAGGVAMALSLMSAGFFAWGVAGPVLAPEVVFASCQKVEPKEPLRQLVGTARERAL